MKALKNIAMKYLKTFMKSIVFQHTRMHQACYQLFCTIVEFPIEPPVIEHDECSSLEFRSSVCSRVSQFLAGLFIFCRNDHAHGVVIKCASSGVLSGSVPLDLTIK